MDSYSVLRFVHVLLFVYWLGADLGVFALALSLRNRNYSYEQRRLMMRMSLTIDLLPRMAFASIAPVGLLLAIQSGLITVSAPVMIAIWSVALLWMVGECIAFIRFGEPIATRIYMATGTLMVIACLTSLGFGTSSVLNGWPVAQLWLAWKILLFGLVFLVSIFMAVFYAPLEGVFNRMAEEGSTDAIEAEIRAYVNKGAAFTVLLFILLAAIGYLGVNKPF